MKSKLMRVSSNFANLVDEIKKSWKNDLKAQGKTIKKISDSEVTENLVERLRQRVIRL